MMTYKHKFIPILGAIPGIKNGGGKGGGIIKGGNIPVGVAAAAGGGFAPLAVASLDVAAPEETPYFDHVALHMYTYVYYLAAVDQFLVEGEALVE